MSELLLTIAISFGIGIAATIVASLFGALSGKQKFGIIIVVMIFTVLGSMALQPGKVSDESRTQEEQIPEENQLIEEETIPEEYALKIGTPVWVWVLMAGQAFYNLLILVLIVRTRRVV